MGGVLGPGQEGQACYYQEVFPGQHFVCVCVSVHVCTHVHLCTFPGVGWAACMLAVIIIEVSVTLPKVPPLGLSAYTFYLLYLQEALSVLTPIPRSQIPYSLHCHPLPSGWSESPP